MDARSRRQHTLSGRVRFTSNTQRHTRMFISVSSRRLIRQNSRRQTAPRNPHTQTGQHGQVACSRLPEPTSHSRDCQIRLLCCRRPVILVPGSLFFRRWRLEKSRKIVGIQRRAHYIGFYAPVAIILRIDTVRLFVLETQSHGLANSSRHDFDVSLTFAPFVVLYDSVTNRSTSITNEDLQS